MRNYLAFDLGASKGRAILGRLENGKLTMKELHRFENNYIEMNSVFYWDLPYLYNQFKLGLLAFKRENVGELDCFGIDTWGVDFGLLDESGALIENPRCYRGATDEEMFAAWQIVPKREVFERTGIARDELQLDLSRWCAVFAPGDCGAQPRKNAAFNAGSFRLSA